MTELTREQAQQRAAVLNREHPERAGHRWAARERAAGWEVVRITLPGAPAVDPLHEAVAGKPRPPQPDDPRPLFWQNVGGPYGPG
jgi:hypothetical protein